MKKVILTLALATAFATVSAQTTSAEKESVKNINPEFNQWSVELAGGFNKPMRPLSAGARTAVVSPYVADLGVRYMFNNKFGIKADFGYNSFTEGDDSQSFDTKYYRADLQAVANLGRIMNFETWTNTLGLLGHAGFGLGFSEKTDGAYAKDRMGNFMAGVTGQIKLSNRIALTGDFTTILNAKQDLGFDGVSVPTKRGFGGVLFNGTVGLTVYLGKNEKHADWVTLVDKDVIVLKDRVDTLETMLIDTDQDGVADYLDLEKNTVSGVMVDSKGRAIDLNTNNVPDELEKYLTANYVNKNDKSASLPNNELIKNLINGGYVATYFDFDKSTPSNVSTTGIDFVLTYLRNNPTATVDIIGHADELGRSEYNDKLSNTRAANVKNILVNANIDASRLNIIAAGEDTSVEKDSEGARKLVRKVTFRIK
ncbi:OmpA family protein [Flavobacterium frigoris]|uniref:OmpA-OmpF porin, OOP family n=1 Tax=Flavobacterium frigoris TaxID=229204 RepID=A0A1H9C2K6_FLAFI|nr:OmpA family protein [Flavobacterium frigoris]SEP95470.1 OmpA-OmpF porin, OOP family [Flavobacterium frigoris]